ncbi:MAG: SIR2 family protein [Colwellia sp.]|nr:SIR2 family protein [Colwellia sp.]
MDFLRRFYDEMLNDEGDVIIANSSFTRSNILSELDSQLYSLSFDEWLEEYKERLREKANEILSLHDNRDRFEQLIRIHSLSNITPFIGAGMSMQSDYPSWTSFLYKACENSHITASDLGALLQAGQYEEAAQLLHDNMTSAVFNELLESTFLSRKEILGSVNYLPLLFPNDHIITTNFDEVIERVYADTDKPLRKIKSGKALHEIARLMNQDSNILIKIHGNCDQISERVLLKDEYDVAYSNEGDVANFFRDVMFRQSLLFIGCSLSEDRTIKKMMSTVASNGSGSLPKHYAFLELKECDDRIVRKIFLAQANIFPIWYQEGEHDESIEALLFKLNEDSNR